MSKENYIGNTVLGTVFPYRPISMRPIASPPISMSKKTLLVMSGLLFANTTLTRKRKARTQIEDVLKRDMVGRDTWSEAGIFTGVEFYNGRSNSP